MIKNNHEKSETSTVPLQCLVSCDGYTHFQIEVTKKKDHFINANVYEISSWDMNKKPCDKELYCRVYMKGDGSCHVWFGEEDESGGQDGYLHLCGVICWKRHIEMMEALYRFAEENILSFADDERWDR